MGADTERPTLGEVARIAGVSKATASKVLNRRPYVSEDTRRRVEEAIGLLGYVPTTGPREAAPLSAVNVVFETLANVYSAQVLNGIVSAARVQGVEVLVDVLDPTDGGADGPLTANWIRRLATRGRAGVIVVTTELTAGQRTQMRGAGINVVVIDPLNPLDDEIVSVGATNFSGGMQATKHLLDLGHRRIAYAGGLPASAPSRERLQGYLNALSEAGVASAPELVLERGFSFPAGREMASILLALEHPPTAIFAGCDTSALGVLEAVRRQGLRVPDDLSIVGFDDTYSAFTGPRHH